MIYTLKFQSLITGFRFWFNQDEIEQINHSNEKFRIKSIEEEQLFKYFTQCDKADATDFLKTSEILDVIFFNHRKLINNGSSKQLGRVLTSNGFVKSKLNGRQVYCLKRQAQNTRACPSESLINTGLTAIRAGWASDFTKIKK